MYDEKTFFVTLNQIDSLISDKPNNESVKAISDMAKVPRLASYLFKSLASPDWLVPLAKAGVFVAPPDTPENQPPDYWFPIDYLLRVVEKRPNEVFDVLKKLFGTNNPYIHTGILQAALALSSSQIDEVTHALLAWLKNRAVTRLYFQKDGVIKFAQRLVALDKREHAKNVICELLNVRTKERTLGTDEHGHAFRDVVSDLDTWEYRNVLEKEFRFFFSAYPTDSLELLYDLLSKAIQCRTTGKPPEDYSTIWCEDVSNPRFGTPNDVEEILVAACRDYSLEFLDLFPTKVALVLEALRKRPWIIFERIALHLISKVPSLDEKVTKAELSKTELLNSYHLSKEYLELLAAAKAQTDDETLKAILSRINRGPNDLFEDPNNPTEDEKKYAPLREAYWKSQRLASLEARLPQDAKQDLQRYKLVIKEHEKDNPRPPTGVWMGPQSSRNKDELLKATDDELLQILKDEPLQPKTHWSASPEGLSRVLTEVVRTDPEKGIRLLSRQPSLAPVFIYGLLSGVREGVQDVREDSWTNLVDALLKLKSNCDQSPSDWRSVKQAMAYLINAALQKPAKKLVSELSDKTWSLIEWLAKDSNPTKEDDEKYAHSGLRAFDLAINTVRGEAIQCAMQYGIKKSNHTEKNARKEFDAAVRSLLTAHLDPKYETSLAIRSVYGRFLPWLFSTDREWLKNSLSALFPAEQQREKERLAVWITYLKFCGVYDDVCTVISDQYAWSVSKINLAWGNGDEDKNPKERLVEHLMTMYWRGILPLESGILADFFANADIRLRRNAISFLGRSALNTKETIPEEILAKFTHLFEARVQSATRTGQFEELAPFGMWFNCSSFPKDWRLRWLKDLLNKGVKIEPDFDLIKTLEGMKTFDPATVLECLKTLIDQPESIRLYSDRDKIKGLLSHYLGTEKQEWKSVAVELTNKMGSRGFLEFRELLN